MSNSEPPTQKMVLRLFIACLRTAMRPSASSFQMANHGLDRQTYVLSSLHFSNFSDKQRENLPPGGCRFFSLEDNLILWRDRYSWFIWHQNILLLHLILLEGMTCIVFSSNFSSWKWMVLKNVSKRENLFWHICQRTNMTNCLGNQS